MTNKIITITGPSTSGKSTLAELFKQDDYHEVVSTTTRPQRTGEIDGVNYHFVNEDEFLKLIENDELVEFATVGKYYYGVSKKAINSLLSKGKDVVIVIEPQGANNVALFAEAQNLQCHKVFVNNPIEVLVDRLQKRYEGDANAKEEVYKDRLWNIAFIEPKEWTNKAYNGEHHYDQIFDTFNPENQQEILNSILSEVNKPKKSLKLN